MEYATQYTVRNLEGYSYKLGEELWDASLVLRNQPIDGPPFYSVDASLDTLDALYQAHHNGWWSDDPLDLLRMLSAAHQLGLEDIKEKSLENLFRNREFLKRPFSPEYPPEAATLVFERFAKGPPRTVGHREELLRLFDNSSAPRSEKSNAAVFLEDRRSNNKRLALESIPVPYTVRTVPAAVISRGDEVHTAIFYGGTWLKVELFGRFLDADLPNIGDFYLDHGRYLLYRSDDAVYKKKTDELCPCKKVLVGCTRFIAREKFVFVVETKRRPLQGSTILMWHKDEAFVPLHDSPWEISFIDFACDRRLLAFQSNPVNIMLSRLFGESLQPIKCVDIKPLLLLTALIHKGSDLSTLSAFCKKDEKTTVRKCVSLETDECEQYADEECDTGCLIDTCLLSRGGYIFQKSCEGLAVARNGVYLNTLGAGECRALSEICLSV